MNIFERLSIKSFGNTNWVFSKIRKFTSLKKHTLKRVYQFKKYFRRNSEISRYKVNLKQGIIIRSMKVVAWSGNSRQHPSFIMTNELQNQSKTKPSLGQNNEWPCQYLGANFIYGSDLFHCNLILCILLLCHGIWKWKNMGRH